MLPERLSLTVVIPFLNEEACVAALVARLLGLRERMRERAELEFVFVDDGSTDASPAMLAALADANSFVKLVSFSRNFRCV